MILWQLLFNLRRRSMFFFLRQNDTYMYVPLSKELFFKFTSDFPLTSSNKLPKMQSPLSRTFFSCYIDICIISQAIKNNYRYYF